MFFIRHIVKDKAGEAIFHELSAMEEGDADAAYQELGKEERKHYHSYLMWRANVDIAKSCAPWIVAGAIVTVIGYGVHRHLSDDESDEEADSDEPND